MKRKVLSICMVLALCLTLLPVAALAENNSIGFETYDGEPIEGNAYTAKAPAPGEEPFSVQICARPEGEFELGETEGSPVSWKNLDGDFGEQKDNPAVSIMGHADFVMLEVKPGAKTADYRVEFKVADKEKVHATQVLTIHVEAWEPTPEYILDNYTFVLMCNGEELKFGENLKIDASKTTTTTVTSVVTDINTKQVVKGYPVHYTVTGIRNLSNFKVTDNGDGSCTITTNPNSANGYYDIMARIAGLEEGGTRMSMGIDVVGGKDYPCTVKLTGGDHTLAVPEKEEVFSYQAEVQINGETLGTRGGELVYNLKNEAGEEVGVDSPVFLEPLPPDEHEDTDAMVGMAFPVVWKAKVHVLPDAKPGVYTLQAYGASYSHGSHQEAVAEAKITITAPTAKIGETVYLSFQKAVDAVKDGQTIELISNAGTAAVRREISFKVNPGAFSYTLAVGDGFMNSNTEKNVFAIKPVKAEAAAPEVADKVADSDKASAEDKAAAQEMTQKMQTAESPVSGEELAAAAEKTAMPDIPRSEKDTAKTDLRKIAGNESLRDEDIVVLPQPYMDVKVTEAQVGADGKSVSLTLDLTLMMQPVMTSKTVVQGGKVETGDAGRNAVKVGAPRKMKVTETVTVTLPVPEAVQTLAIAQNNQVYITHVASDGSRYVYTGTVS